MHTLGYSFAPWRDPQAIADGPSILRYVRRDRRRVRRHRADPLRPPRDRRAMVVADGRCLDRAVRRAGDGAIEELSCSFLFGCCGYYDYDGGYAPSLPGAERFGGPIVHPQQWPEGPRLRGQASRRDRLRRDRDHARPGARAARRTCHDAAALAQLRRLAARPRWARRPRAAVAARDGRLQPFVRAKNVGAADAQLPAQPPPAADDEGAAPGAAPRRRCPPGSTSAPTSTPAMTRGTSACACVPTATCSRCCRTAARRS